MIQRIQTVYLTAAFVILVICFFAAMAEVSTQTGSAIFNLLGSQPIKTSFSLQGVLSFLSGATGVVILGSIFRYKNRKQQMKLTILSFVLLLLITGLTILQVFIFRNTYGSDAVHLKMALIFPLIGAVLTVMGYRGIKHDEELVKSYDRIR